MEFLTISLITAVAFPSFPMLNLVLYRRLYYYCSWWGILSSFKEGRVTYTLKKLFTYLFIERGVGREKERERNIGLVAFHTCPNQGPSRNLHMRPDGNRTGDHLLCGTTLHLLSLPGQGRWLTLLLCLVDTYCSLNIFLSPQCLFPLLFFVFILFSKLFFHMFWQCY